MSKRKPDAGLKDTHPSDSSGGGNEYSILVESDRQSVLHPFSTLAKRPAEEPRIMDSAHGVYMADARGKVYIDGGSGLWCVNIGYGRPVMAEVMAAQSRKLSYAHCFGAHSNAPLIRLAERLLEIAPSGMAKVLFNNSGSEANEAQIKMVRAYNNILGRPAKKTLISRHGAYHGSTIAAGSLTGTDVVHRHFDLPMPGVIHAGSPDFHRRGRAEQSPEEFAREAAREIERLILAQGPDTVAAFIAEPIMGSCGIIIPPPGYFEAIHEVLDRHDVLLIADEVITGFGRTGHWFAGERFGMRPDLMTCAKGMTSGYFPMSACLVGEKVWRVLQSDAGFAGVFGHGFTNAGHPVGAAVALKNLEILEQESLLSNAAEVGGYLLDKLRSRLADHPLVGDIRGYGMLCGVELDADKPARRPFVNAAAIGSMLGGLCWEEGLMVRGAHGKAMVCLAPPLILTPAQADEIVARLERALGHLSDALRRSQQWLH